MLICDTDRDSGKYIARWDEVSTVTGRQLEFETVDLEALREAFRDQTDKEQAKAEKDPNESGASAPKAEKDPNESGTSAPKAEKVPSAQSGEGSGRSQHKCARSREGSEKPRYENTRCG